MAVCSSTFCCSSVSGEGGSGALFKKAVSSAHALSVPPPEKDKATAAARIYKSTFFILISCPFKYGTYATEQFYNNLYYHRTQRPGLAGVEIENLLFRKFFKKQLSGKTSGGMQVIWTGGQCGGCRIIAAGSDRIAFEIQLMLKYPVNKKGSSRFL